MSLLNMIRDMLKDLEDDKFREFCDGLADTDQTPAIGISEVQNKTRGQIAKFVISRCEESGAAARAVQTLRKIGCNNEARILESKCKAQSKAESSSSTDPSPPSSPLSNRVNREVKRPPVGKRSTRKPTIPANSPEVLLLFGRYKGKSLKWLLQNDVGWAVYVVATHQMEREQGDDSQTELMKNKDALAQYVSDYPDIVEDVELYKQGLDPVGFGRYELMTRKELYDCRDEDKKSYVDWLRSMKNAGKGAKMEAMVKYVLQRDRKATVFSKRPPPTQTALPSSSHSAAKKQRI